MEIGKKHIGKHGYVPAPQDKPPRDKKTIALRVLLGFLVVVLACVIAACAYVFYISQQLSDGVDDETLAVLEPTAANEPFYVLILGSDTREEGGTGRSDTIVLARVDTENQAVTLLSIPRDTQVEIEGYGTQKINAAYAYGGSALAVQTVNELCGVSISHVVEVDFSGFEQIVDALGGVVVDVPANTEYKGVSVPEGEDQLINGEQALVLARCRKTYATGDYQRTQNQRNLVQAIAKGVLDADASEMPGLISSLASAITTDMSVTELVDLATSMRGMDTSDMMMAVVPSHTGTVDGVSYVFVEEPAFSEMMARIDAGEDPNATEAADASGNDSDAASSSEGESAR